MALRVKCKCGKVITVPSKLADQKLACPACQKPFRVSREKFEAAAAKAGASAPARPASSPSAPRVESRKPVAAAVAAADDLGGLTPPPDMEIADLSGTIGLSAIDIPMSPQIATNGVQCPSCQRRLPADTKICIDCGIHLETGKKIATSAAVGYARGKAGSAAGQAVKGGFWANSIRSFAYPVISGGNVVTLCILLVVSAVSIVLQYAGGLGLIGRFFIFGWLCAAYLSVIQDTASGSEDLPGIKMEDGILDDIVKPALKYVGAMAVAMAPAAAYLIAIGMDALPEWMVNPIAVFLWIGMGIFVWPVFIMLFAFNALNMIFRLDLIVVTIVRTFGAYLSLWLMLLVVGLCLFIPPLVPFLSSAGLIKELPSFLTEGLVFEFVLNAFQVYLTIVSMRMIGLYYLHFKQRFALELE